LLARDSIDGFKDTSAAYCFLLTFSSNSSLVSFSLLLLPAKDQAKKEVPLSVCSKPSVVATANMDVPFDEWVRNDAQQHCVKNWAEALIQLGASWDSFRRHDDASIVQDLVKAGEIPLLAARDIVRIAKLEIERSEAPLAIFWDMENMPIPANISGREVVSRLKTILQPFGRLTQFRGYASIGLNHIPQQKRSDLQLSGCHLVDAPHNGRKEVADKMIIVDAMQFAFLHPKGATLCFITGDVDYAYLLAVLRRPEWRTIVISKGTISSMLHVNCDMRMRWETDILQLRPATMVLVNDETTPTNQVNGTVDATKVLVPRRDLHPQEDRKASRPSARQSRAMSVERTDDDNNNFESTTGFEPLSLSEQWTDDVELLRCILKGNNNSAFKRQVGSQLRTTNPVRFCDQSAVAKFLSKAIEQGVVIESGEGHYKELSLPEAFRTIKCIPTQKFIPVDMYEAVPDRLVKNLEERPFLMFVPKSYFRGGVRKPKGAFVKDSLRRWLLLMYASMEDVQKAVDEMPHLADCTLVDWRTCQSLDERDLCGHCWRCRTGLLESEIIYKTTKGKALGSIYQEAAFCRDCYEWDKGEKKNAVSRVIEMLSMLAENDDILVGRKTLKKFLYLRYSDSGSCTSYKHAELWIDEAIHTEKVTPFKKGGQKKVWVCLPENLDLAHKENEIDCTLNTLGEEEHVLNCLSEVSHSWVTRSSINESLATSFARMNSPLMRAKVFSNGHVSKRFHVAKGPYGQTVGFTEQEAQESLDRMTKSIKGELEWEFEEVSNLTADVATPTSSRKNETEEVLKDLQQTSTATAETVLTSIQDDLPIETSPANANQHNADSDNGDASDDVSEWDGESIDSAEIDARLRRLTG
jgi:NYN domain